jgi:hypothetical protein
LRPMMSVTAREEVGERGEIVTTQAHSISCRNNIPSRNQISHPAATPSSKPWLSCTSKPPTMPSSPRLSTPHRHSLTSTVVLVVPPLPVVHAAIGVLENACAQRTPPACLAPSRSYSIQPLVTPSRGPTIATRREDQPKHSQPHTLCIQVYNDAVPLCERGPHAGPEVRSALNACMHMVNDRDRWGRRPCAGLRCGHNYVPPPSRDHSGAAE